MFSLLGTGCACPSAPRTVVAYAPAPTHTIFNPDFNSPLPVIHESDWPAAYAAQPVYDDTYYRITIWDHQGRLDQEHDYQRRVLSVQQAFIQR
jgi:hypothetical protein